MSLLLLFWKRITGGSEPPVDTSGRVIALSSVAGAEPIAVSSVEGAWS